jgi:hypothetical protein
MKLPTHETLPNPLSLAGIACDVIAQPRKLAGTLHQSVGLQFTLSGAAAVS